MQAGRTGGETGGHSFPNTPFPNWTIRYIPGADLGHSVQAEEIPVEAGPATPVTCGITIFW